MNRKIGIFSSLINIGAVIGFALCMPLKFNFGSYFFSMFIALSFIPMMWAYAYYSENKYKLAGYISAGFASMYATIILLVYFAQLTTVRLDSLTPQAAALLDFQRFGLLFNYDLLGYALMALSTFFAGLTIRANLRADKWLKYLLMIHGVFFISCLIVPMLGLFRAGGAGDPSWMGMAVLEFWCGYFIPVGILSYLHFVKCEEEIYGFGQTDTQPYLRK